MLERVYGATLIIEDRDQSMQCNAILDHDLGQDDAKVKKGQGCDKNKGDKSTNQTGNTRDIARFSCLKFLKPCEV